MQLVFDEAYESGRLLALVYGLFGMVNATYDNKSEIFPPDDLDTERTHNATGNVEVTAWKLSRNGYT